MFICIYLTFCRYVYSTDMYTALYEVNVIADSKSLNLAKIVSDHIKKFKYRQTKKTIFHVWKPGSLKFGEYVSETN